MTADVLPQTPVANVLPANPVRLRTLVPAFPAALTLTAPVVLVTATPGITSRVLPVLKTRYILTATVARRDTQQPILGEVRLRPRPRPVLAVLLREPVTKPRRTLTATAVPADTLLQLVHLITSKAGQQLKYALAAQLREPAISVKIPVTATAVRLMPVARLRAENRNVLAVPVMCLNLQAVYVSAGLTPNISNAAVVLLF